MSLGSNKNTCVKRLSALAQLIELYAEAKNITGTKELASLTGYSDRAIRVAKAEAGCRKPASARKPGAARKPASALPGSPLPPPSVGTGVAQESLNYTSGSKIPGTPNQTPRENQARSNFFPDEEPIPPLPANFLNPTDKPPAWRGSVLVVTAEQHATWRSMFPGFDLQAGYAIADAECAEKGKLNGAAVIHAQKKLGYLVQDMAVAVNRGLSPEVLKERELEAILRSINPGYMGRG